MDRRWSGKNEWCHSLAAGVGARLSRRSSMSVAVVKLPETTERTSSSMSSSSITERSGRLMLFVLEGPGRRSSEVVVRWSLRGLAG
jgi:hypothetical protein